MSAKLGKQNVVNTISDYAGIALGYVNTVLLMPYLLTTAELGLARALLDTGVLFSQFAMLGAPQVTVRFFPKFQDQEKQKKELLGFSFLLGLIGIVLLSFGVFLFSEPIREFFGGGSQAFADRIMWVIPIGAGMVFFNIIDAVLKANYKTTFGYLMKSVVLRVFWFVILIALWLDVIAFDVFLILYVNAYALILVIIMIKYLPKNILQISLPGKSLDSEFLRYAMKNAAYIFLGASSVMLTQKIDTLMITGLKDLSSNGIYSVAFFFGTAILIPFRSSKRVFSTQLSEVWNKQDFGRLKAIYQGVSKDQLVIAGFLFTILITHYWNIFKILPEEFSAAGTVLVFIAGAKFFDSITGVNGIMIMYSKYIRYFFAFNLLLLVLTVLTNLYFIPRMGIEGAALATTLSIVAVNLARLIFIKIKFGFLPFRFVDLKILLLMGMVLIVGLVVLPVFDSLFLDIFIRTAVVCALYLPLAYLSNVSSAFNKMIEGVFKFVRPQNGE